MSWKMIDRGKSYSCVTEVCQLCVKEAFYILFKPDLAQLNHRSEIFSPCLHKKTALLVKVNTRKRKSSGNHHLFVYVHYPHLVVICPPEDSIYFCLCYVCLKLLVAEQYNDSMFKDFTHVTFAPADREGLC